MKSSFRLIIVISFISFNPTFGQTEKAGATTEIKNKEINWEEFDQTSTIQTSEIKFKDLQGLWNAYEGIYRFGEHVNAMKLTKPFIIEVQNETYRRNSKSEFKNFTIKDNIITMMDNEKVLVGIINKITETELVISWKDKANYTRYYYKK
ncbi:hypothetical protein QO200_19185 [Flavobacterium sp. Arc3]|uniref:hypothetical protein n=1 Tax=Flavobacterium sp. Arc3 TaxID=3046686 RepID=UPI00352DEB25